MSSSASADLAPTTTILQTFTTLGSTIKAIRNLSDSSASKSEFHEFWKQLEFFVKQSKGTFQSICDACTDLDDVTRLRDQCAQKSQPSSSESQMFLCRKIQSAFSVLFDQLGQLEKLCSTESVVFHDETAKIFWNDNDNGSESEGQNQNHELFRTQIHSLMKQVNDRLDNLLKSPLKPHFIPTYVKPEGHSYSSLTDLRGLEPEDRDEDEDSDASNSSSDYSNFDITPTHKAKAKGPTFSFKMKKFQPAPPPRSRAHSQFSQPQEVEGAGRPPVGDLDLAASFRKATTDVSACTLTPDCNCFHCYPLHLPENTPPSSSCATDDEDSDIDTFAVLFDVKRLSNKRNSSRYFGGRDLFEGTRDDDEPEVVKDKLKRMREQEIIWSFEKVLADASEKTFSSMIEKLAISAYHCFIGFWQKLRIKRLRHYRKISPGDIEVYESTKMV